MGQQVWVDEDDHQIEIDLNKSDRLKKFKKGLSTGDDIEDLEGGVVEAISKKGAQSTVTGSQLSNLLSER